MKKVLVVLADGFEEVEGLAPVDLLRRAGCKVITCGIGKKSAISSRKIEVLTDSVVSEEVKSCFDAVVIPGGMPGASNIAASEDVLKILKDVNESGGIIASICAAPAVVLAKWGFLEGKMAVCYPGMETDDKSVIWKQDRVCWDSGILTSRGPGCAIEFSLELIKVLVSEEVAQKIAKDIVLY